MLGSSLSPCGQSGACGRKRDGAFYRVRKPGCSFTLSSGLADSAGRCSPKITLAQEFPIPWLRAGGWVSPGRRSHIPVPEAPSGLSPGPQQRWQKRRGRTAGTWSQVAAPAPLGGCSGVGGWGGSVGPFPFSRVCVSRANPTAGMCRQRGGLGEKTTGTCAVEPSGQKIRVCWRFSGGWETRAGSPTAAKAIPRELVAPARP